MRLEAEVDYDLASLAYADINADGFDDLFAVSEADYGSAIIGFLGGPVGGAIAGDGDADLFFQPNGAGFFDVRVGGDLNCDGIMDLVATGAEQPHTVTYIIYGHASPIPPGSFYDLGALTTRIETGQLPGIVDMAAGVGDVNGDGCDDIGVSEADDWQTGAMVPGRLHLFFGANGQLLADTTLASADVTIDGLGPNGAMFGWDMTAARDFDGDGTGDLLVREHGLTPADAAFYVFYGPVVADGSAAQADLTILTGADAFPEFTTPCGYTNLDGDASGLGFELSDLAIVARHEQPQLGYRIHVFFGQSPGLTGTVTLDQADLQLPLDQLGQISCGGDVDGDQLNDIVAYESLWYGSDLADGAAPDAQLLSPFGPDAWQDATNAGDFNGDGYDDWALTWPAEVDRDIYLLYGGLGCAL